MIRIIILAYNEAANIEDCLIQATKVLGNQPHRFYVVNDGSVDETLSILNRRVKDFPLTLINHQVNQGVAAALRSGIIQVVKQGRANDVVVVMEGDGTSDVKLLRPMIAQVNQGQDIVIASRYQPGGAYCNFSLKRRFFSRSANFIFNWIFPCPQVRDYTIFYRAYRLGLLKKACQVYQNRLINSEHFVANTELLVKLMRLTQKIKELPFTYDYGYKKSPSSLNIPRNLWQYLKFIVLRPGLRVDF
ncbi:glycosyltransferase family 2 protein [Patescibacteria group bacterium]|nr:glycosyltransferase family 2 protein [Patescibacteria group bacterium]MBU1931405.1 glycosyltransferase family 2 protein [Patescibacteria group bacterium]